jgi:hypothetical protein
MITYQQLDVIADSYIPILFVISVFVLALDIFKSENKNNRKFSELISIIVSIAIVYLVMALDNNFGIWLLFELDYSTHTALSLVFVAYLSSKSKTLLVFSVVSFLFYVLLMLYQKYHTIADIISTSVALMPVFLLLFHRK